MRNVELVLRRCSPETEGNQLILAGTPLQVLKPAALEGLSENPGGLPQPLDPEALPDEFLGRAD